MNSDMGCNAEVRNVEKKWKVITNTVTLWSNVPCPIVRPEVGTLI
jgi:hypothetical protein